MGQALLQAHYRQTSDIAAHKPVHKYIQYIIPYLEQRKQIAESLIRYQDEKTREILYNMLDHINYEITKLLDIPEGTLATPQQNG
jgi:hypothetical protein